MPVIRASKSRRLSPAGIPLTLQDKVDPRALLYFISIPKVLGLLLSTEAEMGGSREQLLTLQILFILFKARVIRRGKFRFPELEVEMQQ